MWYTRCMRNYRMNSLWWCLRLFIAKRNKDVILVSWNHCSIKDIKPPMLLRLLGCTMCEIQYRGDNPISSTKPIRLIESPHGLSRTSMIKMIMDCLKSDEKIPESVAAYRLVSNVSNLNSICWAVKAK